MKKSIPLIIVSIIIFLVVGYFIFNYTVKKITEREIKKITQEEIGRVTNQEVERISQSEINRTEREIETVTQSENDRITAGETESITSEEIDKITEEMIAQKTQEIMNQIFGGNAGAGTLREVECDLTPSPRKFDSTPYYTGPLIDAHLHMPFTFEAPKALYQQADWNGPTLEKEVAAGDIICIFDKEKISSGFGFYVVPNLMKGQAVQPIKQVEQQYPGRITPFLMPAHVSGLDLKPEEAEGILNSNKGLFKGYGETAFYKGSFKGVSPDDASLLQIYKIADKHNLIIMIHPDNGQRQAIERILKDYPNVIFLFHGPEAEPWIEDIVGKYPNAYYTIDGSLWDIPNEFQGVNLYDAKNKEEFVFEFKRDYNKLLNGVITKWKGAIEKHPDKFLWGTDRAYEMHFDPEVGALLEEIGRSFIGKLDLAVQEKFAYRNAERIADMSGIKKVD